jgi:hypothetical protein
MDSAVLGLGLVPSDCSNSTVRVFRQKVTLEDALLSGVPCSYRCHNKLRPNTEGVPPPCGGGGSDSSSGGVGRVGGAGNRGLSVNSGDLVDVDDRTAKAAYGSAGATRNRGGGGSGSSSTTEQQALI